jgi:hypothetical protein
MDLTDNPSSKTPLSTCEEERINLLGALLTMRAAWSHLHPARAHEGGKKFGMGRLW